MLGSADQTAYDLRFRLLEIPVRVNPWFWLVMLMISGENARLERALVFVACGFVSILVHEFGHGLSSRFLGGEPSEIVLYGMGGYCVTPGWYRATWMRLVMIACGPGAGFLLFGAILVGASMAFRCSPLDLISFIGIGDGTEDRIGAFHRMSNHPMAMLTVFRLLEINFWWSVLNLLPIWPLDGGRMAEIGLTAVNRREGQRWTHVLALATAGGLALWSASNEEYLRAIWFGYFGYINYQVLQSLRNPFGSGDWRY